MQLFNGLYLYEIILLCLGALLFLVLLVALVVMLIKGHAIKSLLWFFLVSILMMGFPAVSSIKIKDIAVELKRQTEYLEKNPTDQAARAAVAQTVETVTARTYSDPVTLTTIAKAQIALGQEVRAQTTAQRALEADPDNQEAAQVSAQVEAARELPEVTKQAEQNPADPQAKAAAEQKLKAVLVRPVVDPKLLAKVAQAQAATGETQKAQATAEKANQIDPNLKIDIRRYQLIKPSVTASPEMQNRKFTVAPPKQGGKE